MERASDPGTDGMGNQETDLAALQRLQARRREGASWAWAAASVLLALASALLWNASTRLKNELATNRGRMARLERRLEEERKWAEVSSAPGARVALLRATRQGNPDLSARAIYDPTSRRAVVLLSRLRAPAAHDYQLWGLHGAMPASLGMVHADANGEGVLILEDAGDPATLAAFAVSLEPAGGSPNPAPSGPVVMLGKLGG